MLRAVPDDVVTPMAEAMAGTTWEPPGSERLVAELQLRSYVADDLLSEFIEVNLPSRLSSIGAVRAENEHAKLHHLLQAGWQLAERTIGLGHVLEPLGEVCAAGSGELVVDAEHLRQELTSRRDMAVEDRAEIEPGAWRLPDVRTFVMAALLADRLSDDGYADPRGPRSTKKAGDGAYL